MAKKNPPTDPELKATVKRLRADLKQSEAKRAKWKNRAATAVAALADVQTRLRRTDKEARKALKRADSVTPAIARSDAPTQVADADPGAISTDATTRPDPSWTVAQLRAEARKRGLTGLTGKPKADLLKALT